jgi:type I restriction enzyme S subunit
MNAQRLKNAILQEAIEGRLVPQDPNDEPASVLLARIRKEKERLVKEGKLKRKDLEVKPISEDEIPFEIPESWEWVRLGDVTEIKSSKRVFEKDYVTTGIPFFRSKEIGDLSRGEQIHTELYITKEHYCDLKEKYGVPQKGDILLTSVGSIGNFWICDGREFYYKDGNVTQICVNDSIKSCFITLFLSSQLFSVQTNTSVSGTAYNALTIIKLKSLLFPLPPLAEQHRIVAKIEELLPKVEEYGKAQEALNKLNAELPERLKKSILQEAIEGRLVPQNPNDEPASVLLAKIRQEKAQLVKAGKLKKKDLIETPIPEDEIPFEIPDSWEWCRLGDIGIFERGNGIKRDETFESGYPCVRYGEMYTKYKYAPTFEKTVSFTSKSVFEKCRKAHKGDLFMALTGENKQDISLAAQYVGDEEIAVGGDLCHFAILEAYGLYYVYLINSTYFSSKKEILATGDIIVHISTDKLASIPIPLPPLAEQHRIVEKLEQLFGEIEKLK